MLFVPFCRDDLILIDKESRKVGWSTRGGDESFGVHDGRFLNGESGRVKWSFLDSILQYEIVVLGCPPRWCVLWYWM
jgi:hypothetical protein